MLLSLLTSFKFNKLLEESSFYSWGFVQSLLLLFIINIKPPSKLKSSDNKTCLFSKQCREDKGLMSLSKVKCQSFVKCQGPNPKNDVNHSGCRPPPVTLFIWVQMFEPREICYNISEAVLHPSTPQYFYSLPSLFYYLQTSLFSIA